MTHEPECPIPQHPDNAVCFCEALRACAARVREEERALICVEQTSLAELNAAYRRGFNGHATAALEWKATHGAYGPYLKRLEEGIVTVEQAREWNQHGKGENP